ncbi:GAF and ANTAR domain-containing protein [Rhodococcus sp. NPDC058521]|uniref:GAF and ANTAR domain-containing protein n=1 Tax=Rhodococcus sp. NPDC058521 TaxID=3346536 RepID=UPI003659AB7F
MSTKDTPYPRADKGRDVAAALTAVARSLEAEPDVERTVTGIVHAVADTIPAVDHAAVSMCAASKLRSVAATSELAAQVNAIEHKLGDGPCVDAVRFDRIYRIDLMEQETRWPRFAAAAHDLGIESMLGYRLFTSERTLGSLDLYAFEPNAFNADAELTGELFAAHAAIALIGSTQEADLRYAIRTRDAIGMAKGILMGRENVTADKAFAMLVGASQHANMKLHDVAAWLTAEHDRTAHGS